MNRNPALLNFSDQADIDELMLYSVDYKPCGNMIFDHIPQFSLRKKNVVLY